MAASLTCPLICAELFPVPPAYASCLAACVVAVDVFLLDPPGREIPFEDLTQPDGSPQNQ